VLDGGVLRVGRVHRLQSARQRSTTVGRIVIGRGSRRAEIYPTLDDAFLRWPLPAGAERYGAIDGKCMHKDVVEQAQISRRYRDAGHPKFWGRITGTSSDAESAQWLAAKFKATGLSDVRIQPLDLEPQWMPQTWEAVITDGGKTIRIESAQPFYGANAVIRKYSRRTRIRRDCGPCARVAAEPARGLWSTWPGRLGHGR
jgi:hypothetical protein